MRRGGDLCIYSLKLLRVDILNFDNTQKETKPRYQFSVLMSKGMIPRPLSLNKTKTVVKRKPVVSSMAASLMMFVSVYACLFVFLLLTLMKILDKFWWTPMRIQHLVGSQGIKGPCYRFIYGNTKEIIKLRNEASAKPILTLSHDIFSKVQPQVYTWINAYDGAYTKAEATAYVKKLLGDGLVTAEGDKWAKQRKLANYAFHGESLKGMVPVMISSVEMMLERWKNHQGKEIDVSEEFRLLTSEVISRTAFGSSYLEGKKTFDLLLKLSVLANRNAFKVRLPVISKFWKTADEKEAEKLVKGIWDSVVKMTKKREDKVLTKEADSFGTDFLGSLVNAYHDTDEKKRISIEDSVDECKTFYIAGQETSSTMLGWTVLLLAIHTDWQEAARKEVISLFGNQNPHSDAIVKLKTMTMIIKESLRLYPPVISISRKVERQVQLGKLFLPAGMTLYIANMALHHDPQIWGEDVHLFKPERFSEGVAKATRNNPAAFFPFGLGPRTCMGSNFAITEAKIVLSMILQRYTFTLSPSYIHSPFTFVTVRPQHGIQVMLHRV
ncbi:hypothetical protein Dsin_009828 [Dipteronia sinensis]|uniref:Cytochrome P450 n=1 Tax=Dipteronia sinensis TaxID=43782 RepID=A0AAE0EC04_9ROSI|nr:hypothetical protein Dsin_009828 [Dipteronia sinensis]